MSKFLRKLEFEKVIKALWNTSKSRFIEEITFDNTINQVTNKPKNTLSKNKNGQETPVIDHLVTEWKDLDHVSEINSTNVFDAKNLKYGKYFNNFAPGLVDSSDYAYYTFDCNPGDTFTVVKKQHDSQTFGFLDTNGNVIENRRVGQRVVNGRTYYHLTVPQTPTIVKAGFNIHLPTNKVSEVELHSGHIQPTADFMPNTNGAEIIVDGTQVSINFDPMDSGLSSTTVESAIRESVLLSNTSLSNKVDRSEVGTGANQIPQLDQNGKLPSTIIPNIAITKIVDVADEAEALNMSTNNEIQTGDFVRIANNQNKIYIHRETSVGNFSNRFIEITSGNAGNNVSSVNGQTPSQGNVTVDATHIKLDGQNSQTVKQEIDTLKGRVDNCVTRVNGQAPINGEVTVNAGQINGTYGGSAGNLQSHLNTIKNSIDSVTSRANDNANRLTKLETKVPTVKVGDIISTFQDSGSQYVVGGVTYLYIGQTRTVQHSTYPQLASALGISGATNYQLPIISDTSFTFDNGQRRRNRKHYIVAHISS